VAPRNEIEEVLVRVWSELIDAPRIGVRDNFFDLGGHSLHATRHMFRIRELLEIDLPVRALYEAPTIEQLAQRVEERLIEELEGMSDAEVEGLV
jgi:acyl carrier protein